MYSGHVVPPCDTSLLATFLLTVLLDNRDVGVGLRIPVDGPRTLRHLINIRVLVACVLPASPCVTLGCVSVQGIPPRPDSVMITKGSAPYSRKCWLQYVEGIY